MKKSHKKSGIGGKLRRGKKQDNLIHLPDNLLNPTKVAVFSGPEDSDVWPAIYLTNILQQVYSEVHITVICRRRDGELFNMLKWRPRVHFYESSPKMPALEKDEAFTDDTLLFYPYDKMLDSSAALISQSGAGVRVAPLKENSSIINIRVRSVSRSYPGLIHEMCQVLGIKYDPDWKPSIQHQAHDHASELMAPISGRSMPYFVTSSGALALLEKNRAEIPLRTVSLAGKTVEFPNLSRELRTAIISGASAVATDSADLWGDACALGIPVVGLAVTGSFMKWDTCQTHDSSSEFLDAWAALLRIGW